MVPLDDLWNLLTSIYDAGLDGERWPAVLQEIAALFAAPYGGLTFTDPVRNIRQVVSLGADPAFCRTYEAHYGRLDPIIPHVIAAASGTLLTDSMVMPRAILDRTEFFQDWVRPQGYYSVLAGNFLQGGTGAGVVLVSRRQRDGDFAPRDRDLLGMLLVHLQRAMQIHGRLASLHAERHMATEVLNALRHAILVTDGVSRILLANRSAEALLAEGDGLRAGPRGLQAATATQTGALRRLVAQAAGSSGYPPIGGALALERPSLKRPLQVLISPLRAELGWAGLAWQSPTVLVLVIDPERAPETSEKSLKALYHLTHAEARVAREVAKGEGVATVAAALGMLPSTARTHLHQVFAKTGTRRQAELVRLLERLALLGPQAEHR